jgi:hypothetical protein
MKRSRLHSYSLFVAFFTLLVVVTGATVTSSHGLLQNAHEIAGVVDGLLVAGLSLWRGRGWSFLGLVIVDAGLGVFHGAAVETLHACLGGLAFAGAAVISLKTSLSWEREPELVQDYGRPSLRFLSALAAVLVGMQVALGAAFRHSAMGVLPHLLGAMVVVLFVMIVGAFVTTQFPKHGSLRPMAIALMTIAGIQVFLGMAAFLMRLMNMAGMGVFVAISVAHVATGNVILAVSVMLTLEIRRSVLPAGDA